MHSSLYRPSDIAIGAIHGGIFMFRDVFARVNIPTILGQCRLEPLSCTDLSERQKKWLSSRAADLQMFDDQFIDIFDFGGGIGHFFGYQQPPRKRLRFSALRHFSSRLQQLPSALLLTFAELFNQASSARSYRSRLD